MGASLQSLVDKLVKPGAEKNPWGARTPVEKIKIHSKAKIIPTLEDKMMKKKIAKDHIDANNKSIHDWFGFR